MKGIDELSELYRELVVGVFILKRNSRNLFDSQKVVRSMFVPLALTPMEILFLHI